MPLHTAFYDTRSKAGAVVHLHSCHSVALSMLPDVDPDNFLPPLTPYGIMKLGRVKLLPFFLPGDAAMGEAVRGLAGKRSAVMLANHGPVVAGKDVEAACNAVEELEDTARLALMTRGMNPRLLDEAQIRNCDEIRYRVGRMTAFPPILGSSGPTGRFRCRARREGCRV